MKAVPYRELEAVRMIRRGDERIDGRPTLLLDLRSVKRLYLAVVNGLGGLHEVADALSAALRASLGAP